MQQGVVAPASGEGIYYAMEGGTPGGRSRRCKFLASGDAKALRTARRRFMKAHGRVFWILRMMQWFWYSSDKRRERFVSICQDPDVQRLTWDSYMNKRLTRRDPMAHVRIFFKDLAHLLGYRGRVTTEILVAAAWGIIVAAGRRFPDGALTLVSCAEEAVMAAAGLVVRASLDINPGAGVGFRLPGLAERPGQRRPIAWSQCCFC